MQDCIIPQILCLLLNQEELRIPACECLLMFVSRKVSYSNIMFFSSQFSATNLLVVFQGKFEQYQEYVRLFSEDGLQFMKTAARQGNVFISLVVNQ